MIYTKFNPSESGVGRQKSGAKDNGPPSTAKELRLRTHCSLLRASPAPQSARSAASYPGRFSNLLFPYCHVPCLLPSALCLRISRGSTALCRLLSNSSLCTLLCRPLRPSRPPRFNSAFRLPIPQPPCKHLVSMFSTKPLFFQPFVQNIDTPDRRLTNKK